MLGATEHVKSQFEDVNKNPVTCRIRCAFGYNH